MSQDYISNPEEARDYLSRYKFFYFFVSLTVLIFVSRLIYLQIISGRELRYFSERNRVKQNKIQAPRGLVLDRDGKALVENLPGFEAVLTPQYIQNRKELAELVGPVIGLDPARVVEKIERSGRLNGPFATVRLKDNLSRDEVFRLKRLRLDLPGLEIRESIIRYYPLRENGAQLFGYVGEISKKELNTLNKIHSADSIVFEQGDIVGKNGLEEFLEKKIRGSDGVRFIQVNAHGRTTITDIPNIYGDQIQDIEPIHGHSATLTIDKDVQLAAFESFKKHNRMGSAVAIKPDGEVLAWLNLPSFDPNYFATDVPAKVLAQINENPFKPFRNKVIQDHFSPGSTFKPLVALAALQEKVITDKSTLYSPGKFFFGGRWYHNHNKEGEGVIGVYEALERSSNVFFYQLGIKLGVDKMYNYISLLGLGSKTGIEMTREVRGLLPNSTWKQSARGEPWQPGENLSTAIGQGYVTVTPLQMAIAFNTIATEGKVVKPYVVKKVTDHEGKMLFERFPTEVRDVTLPQPNGMKISVETFRVVKEGLRRVANGKRGTARAHKVPGVEIAGKTGTAQVVNFSADQIYAKCDHRPINLRHHGWYVAWAPWDKPEITVAVFAQHGCSGSGGAAPIARDIFEAYFRKHHPAMIEQGLKMGLKRAPEKTPTVRVDSVPEQEGE
jgi:penicillin-binding protein 2